MGTEEKLQEPAEASKSPQIEFLAPWFFGIFVSLEERGFYGKMVITYQNGKVVNVKREESIKVPSAQPAT